MSDLKASTLIVYSDGGSRGNPGQAAGAVVMFWAGKEIESLGWYLGVATNNVAEYTALLNGILRCQSWSNGELPFPAGSWSDVAQLEFRLDSLLVVEQLNGRYRIKDSNMQNLSKKVFEALGVLGLPHRFVHVPRAQNSKADALVNQVLDDRKA